MPLYEYKCDQCGKVFEKMQKFSDSPLATHEECGGTVERLISAPSFHFKGSGWYVTDYAKGGKSEPNGSGNKNEGSEKKDAGGDSSDKSSKKKDLGGESSGKASKETSTAPSPSSETKGSKSSSDTK